MMHVDNKKIVSEVALTTYKANKNRNIITIIAIILTTFLITSIMGIGFTYYDTIKMRSIRMEGMDYDIELSEPKESQVLNVKKIDTVKHAGVIVKCGIGTQFEEKKIDKIRFYWADPTCFDKQCIPAFEFLKGQYPKKENEILLSLHALKKLGIKKPKIGMELQMTYYPLNQGNTEQMTNVTFFLSGYYKDYTDDRKAFVSEEFYIKTDAKQTDFTQGFLKITLKNPLYSKKDIMKIQNEIGISDKQYMSSFDDNIANFIKTLLALSCILILTMLSGYLFIFNTLYISISKDIRFYGQLKTIGMTSKQLKKIIYKQAFLNASIGIPIGILCSYFVMKSIIMKIMTLLVDEFYPLSTNNQLWFYICGFAMIFTMITIFISSRKPAHIVGECSPIEALKYTIHSKNKKEKMSEKNSFLSMALTNIFRDKKQAIVIIMSFFLSISVFIVINVIIYEFNAKHVLNNIFSNDIQLINDSTLEEQLPIFNEEKLAKLKDIEGIREVKRVFSLEISIPYQEDVFGDYYKDLYKSRHAPGDYKDDIKAYKKDKNAKMKLFSSRIIGIDHKTFEELNKSLGNILDKEDFIKGKAAFTQNFLNISPKSSVGKKVVFLVKNKNGEETQHAININGINDKEPIAYFSSGYTPELIVSEAYLKTITEEPHTELLKINYKNSFDYKIEKQVKNIFNSEEEVFYHSKLEQYEEMKKSENQVKILGNGMACILALLTILNYVNMLLAGIESRAKEFAILESIGMTKKQIKKVLRIEGLIYAIISIILAMLLGIPLSYLVFQSMNMYGLVYIFPLFIHIVLFGIVIVLCIIIPPFIYKIRQKENIIEQLREVHE